MTTQRSYANSHPVTLEAQYVSRTVGPALKKGLAELVEKRPIDPVEYLANFLFKFAENKKQQELDEQNRELVEKLRIEKEEEERRFEEMRLEAEAIRQREEEERRETEAEEKRKRELEELAKRKEEIANAEPPLPSVVEEEDQIVEFGQTKLHDAAAQEGANLTILLKQNYSPAARNSNFKTPREVASELNLADNVKQIDDYIYELVEQENYKQLTDLIVLGFDELISIIEAKYGNADQMREKDMNTQADKIYVELPQLQAKLREIQNLIIKNDLEGLKQIVDQKFLLYLRDGQGKSPLVKAIEAGHFEIALFLIEKCPLLLKINDCNEKLPEDYMKQIDPTSEEAYKNLMEKFQSN